MTKRIFALFLASWLAGLAVFGVKAQSTDSIWLTADTTSYKTGETVTVLVNAIAGTPVQGFTFQIRYDPACLKPIKASSPVPGMNGLALPQISGQVDGSYASTVPQTVNGVLAQVYFQALGGCETNLTLESAALAIRNEQGFAAPLPGVMVTTNMVAMSISKEVGESLMIPVAGANLPLEPTIFEQTSRPISGWWIGLLVLTLAGGAGWFLFKRLRPAPATPRAQPVPASVSMNRPPANKVSPTTGVAAVHFKRGPYAGKSIPLNRLPVLIGRNPTSDICLNDPHILDQHARIFETNNGYYLMDLGGETYVNGQMVKRNSAFLKPGDVVRLGKSALFVFGS